jgi:hypothetical protein
MPPPFGSIDLSTERLFACARVDAGEKSVNEGSVAPRHKTITVKREMRNIEHEQ